MKTEKIQVRDLKPYERNAKKHDEKQIANVMESIRQFGVVQPVVVDRDNVVIIGHCRLIAAKRLKMKEIDCVRADDLTPEEVNKLRLLDNKLNESEWDMDLLAEDIPELDFSGFDIDWGLKDDFEEEPDAEEDDFEPQLRAIPNIQAGDIITLGRHRLVCGDATSKEAMETLMEEDADLYITDPPYNVALGIGGSKDEARKRHRRTDGLVIMNDHMEDEEFRAFLASAFQIAKDHLKDGAAFYIWHAGNEAYNFGGALRDVGLELRQTLIWVKNVFTLGRQDYQWIHEHCLYGWKDGASHYFVPVRNIPTAFETVPDIKNMKAEEMRKLLSEILQPENVETTILREKKPSRSEMHPTMKPIKLIGKQIKNSSKKGDIVLDSFGGSGSTLIACEQLERICYTMELDPRYAESIVDRFAQYKGTSEGISIRRGEQVLTYEQMKASNVEEELSDEG